MVAVRFRPFALSLALLGLAHLASADPPDRAARLSYVSGSVSFRPASLDEWSGATRNYPLTVGDHLWTDRGGRAELELGSTFVRVGPSTEFSLLNLDDRLAQLRITQGTALLRVRDLADGGVEVATPNGAVTIDQPGFYRVDVDESGASTIVTVRSGRAEVTAGDAAYIVGARQSVVFSDGQLPYTLQVARAADDFESWSLARDRRVEASVSVRYVSPNVIGYEDFDEYGSWRDAPGYGQAWYPRVRADWAPYRFGHWAWVEPWGWTWIDDEPWGFAPSHYGRWLHARDGWAWIPGSRAVRPVYAPALVLFVGGSGWQASFSVGSAPVGWFPLGPREAYVPGYGASAGYLRAVNAPHVEWRGNVDVSRTRYANRDVPGAFTAVPRDTFERSRPVGGASLAVPRDAFRNATPTQAGPGRPSRVFAGSERRGSAPPAAAIDRSVVVRRTPPDAARARFRNAPQGIAPAREAPVQPGRPPRRFDQPVEPRGPRPQVLDRPEAQPRQAPERVIPREQPRQERAAPQERAVPRERVAPQERVAPRERVAPQERVTPQEPPRPERIAPQERPRQERAAPQERPQPERRPRPERVIPQERPQPQPRQERAAPQERRQERAAPQERRQERAAPQERPQPRQERAAPQERQPNDNGKGKGGGKKKDQ